jgi:polysaccharide export outer membrane protein
MRILKFNILALAMITIVFTSCGPSKKVHEARLYVRGIDTSQTLALKVPEPVIQKSDILSVVVFSDNPEATALFNQPIQNSGGGGTSTGAPTAGYLVDVDGDIYFHSLGQIHVAGLTKHQVTELIKEKLTGIFEESLCRNQIFECTGYNVGRAGQARNN